MSDPQRPSARSSKTAAVVMLVVFLQVLVVAVLGLGAISRDRKEARRVAEERAEQRARSELASTVIGAEKEVRKALQDIRLRVRRFEDLQLLRSSSHRDHADLIATVYHVDPDTNEIVWLDGEHRLYVPPLVRQQRIAQQAEPASVNVYRAHRSRLTDDYNKSVQLQSLIALVHQFPYWEGRYHFPAAVGDALRLVQMAPGITDLRASRGRDEAVAAYDALERAFLSSLETVALNRDRIEDLPESDRPTLDHVEAEVEAAVAGLPKEQARVRDHVEAYRQARKRLETGLRDELLLAVKQGGPVESVVRVGDHLFGLVPNVALQGEETSRHAVVLLNEPALVSLIEQKADQSALNDLGLELRVTPVGEPSALEAAAAADLSHVSGLQVPHRAELHRTRVVELPVEGPGELFYWGIIALAAGGLGMGAYVLSRLYTREVRLARLKADFVSNLSHELKTPLTSIGMFTEMLQEGQLTSDEDRTEALGILAQESERLQGIVARMLDVARREARGVPYELRPGDLNPVVYKAAERFRRIVTEPGLDLGIQLSPEPLILMLNEAALNDVVTNLVNNAWKYRQGDRARIDVRTARRGRKAELVVSDDGKGIQRRDRRKVFEMFYRSDAYLTKVSGTGLGLALVRTIVRAHRGTIRIENGEGGRGTLFRIRFPLAKVGRTTSTSSTVPVASSTRSTRSEAQAPS